MDKRTLIFAISPGGQKHEVLSRLLADDGYNVFISEEDDLKNADFYITPKAKNVDALLSRGITPIEYLKRQDFKECNGILTAEAAITEAQIHTPFSTASSRVLVTGSGCIAFPLACKLNSLGAYVTVAARSNFARTKARLMGFAAYDLCFMGGEYDIIFNTVPAQIFDKHALKSINTDTVIIDLASLPGGVDKDAAAQMGITVIPALALPGKHMPETSAKIIRTCVHSYLKEMIL